MIRTAFSGTAGGRVASPLCCSDLRVAVREGDCIFFFCVCSDQKQEVESVATVITVFPDGFL